MSRIIIKNLPKGIKENRLRDLFGQKGHITDCSMKFTKGGAFRKFAFIGYKSSDEASLAVKHFNNTFVDTSRVTVEFAKDLGDDTKGRAWSKYSKESSAYKKLHGGEETENKDNKKGDKSPKKKDKKKAKGGVLDDMLGDLKDDPQFQEFLEEHNGPSKKSTGEATTNSTLEQSDEDADEHDEEMETSTVEKKSKKVAKLPANAKAWEVKLAQKQDDEETEPIAESGRLYVRNLAYCCTEDDIEGLFGEFGPVTEVNLPVDNFTKKVKGFAFITFMMPEHAVQAYTKLDGTTYQGRILHILPAKAKKDDSLEITDNMSFKKKREIQQKAQAGSSHNWNALFLGANAVADVMAEKYNTTKSQLLNADQKQSLGVRMALGETQIVSETREFLVENGVALDSFSQAAGERSKTVILVKNLPASTSSSRLQQVFEKYGSVGRVVLPPSGITAMIEFVDSSEAKKAFTNLAYTKFEHVPLYLEWAPINVFGRKANDGDDKKEQPKDEVEEDSSDDETPEEGSSLFVKNLNFDTTDKSLADHFSKCGRIQSAKVAKKKDLKKPGNFLSMGYGFVTFLKKDSAEKALKTMQHSMLDDHQIELKISNREAVAKNTPTQKKKQEKKKQKTTKILVRNVPFEAKLKEVKELFSVFGELKTVRMPKKMQGTGSHRGFAFVDFLSKQDAKRAFNALCHSTHLYGRRLVLEWAETDETVDKLRKKTAEHFHEGAPTKKFKKAHLLEDLKASETLE